MYSSISFPCSINSLNSACFLSIKNSPLIVCYKLAAILLILIYFHLTVNICCIFHIKKSNTFSLQTNQCHSCTFIMPIFCLCYILSFIILDGTAFLQYAFLYAFPFQFTAMFQIISSSLRQFPDIFIATVIRLFS